MEHAQREYFNGTLVTPTFEVLILILMEHAQRVTNGVLFKDDPTAVLILILMEHAQRENGKDKHETG